MHLDVVIGVFTLPYEHFEVASCFFGLLESVHAFSGFFFAMSMMLLAYPFESTIIGHSVLTSVAWL